jgi:hypothetical protein
MPRLGAIRQYDPARQREVKLELRGVAAVFNLRNRSFLKELDFEPRELRFLLQLSEALKVAKYSGTEVKRLDGLEIALTFEKTSTRRISILSIGVDIWWKRSRDAQLAVS